MSELLPNRLLDIAAARPDATALIEPGSTASYRELAEKSRAFATALRDRIVPGDRVAIALDNGISYAVSCYGIWLAGGVVVGLNTALRPADLLWQIDHCGAVVVVASEKLAAGLRSARVLSCELIVDAVAGVEGLLAVSAPGATAATTTLLSLHPEMPAQIIYTSGTTGLPKGVLLSHGNLAANTASIQQCLQVRPSDIAMCVLPFFYSFGNSVLHSHLTIGSTLVLENSFMYPQVVLNRMAELGVTAFYGVPSTYYLLLARGQLDRESLRRLRFCAQAGGAMDKARVERFAELMPWADFVVMYGQTEATARLTWLEPSLRILKAGSVGRPIPGVEMTIRGENDVDLPVGQTGEVCARGPNIMQGYWRDPETTSQVLRNGWLHTGDLGFCDADGCLFLVGRSKEMIKSGAHRISPREIEEVIATVPEIGEVAVIGVDDDILGQAIKACVIGEESDGLRRQILRACREQLPLYKVPKEVAFYAEFPRTQSGKIRKHLL
jgi:acyl-CoA synthetase (AMP-forming)/AMP-acid ligase II